MLQSGEKIAITADFINRVDRHMSAMPEGFGREFVPPSGTNGTTVLVYNVDSVPLEAYTAVKLGAGERINQGTVIFAATQASTNATQKIAILQMTLAPGQAGPAIVSGGSLVRTEWPLGVGDYVSPIFSEYSAGIFSKNPAGLHRVLWMSKGIAFVLKEKNEPRYLIGIAATEERFFSGRFISFDPLAVNPEGEVNIYPASTFDNTHGLQVGYLANGLSKGKAKFYIEGIYPVSVCGKDGVAVALDKGEPILSSFYAGFKNTFRQTPATNIAENVDISSHEFSSLSASISRYNENTYINCVEYTGKLTVMLNYNKTLSSPFGSKTATPDDFVYLEAEGHRVYLKNSKTLPPAGVSTKIIISKRGRYVYDENKEGMPWLLSWYTGLDYGAV